MNLISSKIAKHMDVLKLFARIVLRKVGPQQLQHNDVTTNCCETLAQALALWRTIFYFPMLPSCVVRNNSVRQRLTHS